MHPTDPSRSLIIGTVTVAAPAGAVVAYGLDGQIRQMIAGIDCPNNVDVEYGIRLGGQPVDIAVATERLARQLRIFRIDRADGRLTDLGGAPILRSEQDEAGAPMGVALYRRERDNAVFAIVAPKTGPREGYLWQYRLSDAGGGRIAAAFVRRFGTFSASTVRAENEIEAVAVDDALGYVYYADEADGIHKWHADPAHPDAGRELAHFARTGFRGDREGIGIMRSATEPATSCAPISSTATASITSTRVRVRPGIPTITPGRSRSFAAVRMPLTASTSRRPRSVRRCPMAS